MANRSLKTKDDEREYEGSERVNGWNEKFLVLEKKQYYPAIVPTWYCHFDLWEKSAAIVRMGFETAP